MAFGNFLTVVVNDLELASLEGPTDAQHALNGWTVFIHGYRTLLALQNEAIEGIDHDWFPVSCSDDRICYLCHAINNSQGILSESPARKAVGEHFVTFIKTGLSSVTHQSDRRQIQSLHLLVFHSLRHEIECEVRLIEDRRAVTVNRFERHDRPFYPVNRRHQGIGRSKEQGVKSDTNEPPIVVERHPADDRVFLGYLEKIANAVNFGNNGPMGKYRPLLMPCAA